MMPKIALSAVLLCAAWIASARAAELYDPNLMPYNPSPVSLSQCGVSIGLDKDWIFNTREKTGNGRTE